jgi:hypothetical protein
VQVAKLVKSELKVYGKWSLDSAAIGVAWLDDHVCVFFLANLFVSSLFTVYFLCFLHYTCACSVVYFIFKT